MSNKIIFIPCYFLLVIFKSSVGRAVLDISLDEDLVNLTERGEEIVNGELGITQTSLPANF
jgi:hypothetical protein